MFLPMPPVSGADVNVLNVERFVTEIAVQDVVYAFEERV
jgi:hypothetical protein